jgi:hypothetical protein
MNYELKYGIRIELTEVDGESTEINRFIIQNAKVQNKF